MYYFTHPHLITTHDVIFFSNLACLICGLFAMPTDITVIRASPPRAVSACVTVAVHELLNWTEHNAVFCLCVDCMDLFTQYDDFMPWGWLACDASIQHACACECSHTESGWWELTWIICSVTCGCVPGVSYIDGWCLGWISFLVIPAVRCTQLLWSLFLPLDTRFLN